MKALEIFIEGEGIEVAPYRGWTMYQYVASVFGRRIRFTARGTPCTPTAAGQNSVLRDRIEARSSVSFFELIVD